MLESVKIGQRIYKSGHEVLNLALLRLSEEFCHRHPRLWEISSLRLVERCDAVICLDNLEQHNALISVCMQENIPVFTSFDEWLNTLSD